MLSNISIPLLGMIDTAILGHLDTPQYLGAAAVGGNIMSLVLWTFAFLRMGSTALVAQQYGAGSPANIQLTIVRSLVLAGGISVVLLAARTPLLASALHLIDASAEVDPLARSYSEIRFYSVPAVLFTYCLTGWLIGSQATRAVMLIIITTNSLNIALDYLFIVVYGWNSDGAALATVVAEYVGCAIAFSLLWHTYRGRWQVSIAALRDSTALVSLLRINVDLMLRTLCLLLCFLFFTAQGARAGDTLLAANTILMQLLLLSAFALDGFAHACESLCGFELGAGRIKQFYATVRACLLWSVYSAVGISLVFFLLQNPIIAGFTDIDAVRTELQRFFPWLIALPLVSVWSYLFDGVFIGAAKTRAMRDSMIVSAVLVYLPVWYFAQPLGNHGLWLAFNLFMAARGVTLAVVFWNYSRREKWLP
ncbi:MAG: MATE family efflux transporter [Pseudomonadales bacterium]